ncbi:unnamed protein product [Vitrella brassicaformis CCMP3155]|uniref:Uncharacterized protein n=1 Tax=Vitrella brassicaformis (strain CCMP3155) TaxID=1169540 RepID=A0A0G4ERW7_VITBC|nr:unnamed protein product [Vitrella brassicaformis CCMP3155]|eukprot:CEM00966.1 unnamed protein product [Vitrella brassicaformis CCMP3155]
MAAVGLLAVLVPVLWSALGDVSEAAAGDGGGAAIFDPDNFRPVCGASDKLYRVLQSFVMWLVGKEAYDEYGPLIAGGLLRVRLEFCIVESFYYEGILPFIKERGLSWVLPLHETVETFIAGTVFAVATNFVLIGSTKIITVFCTYADFFFGLPSRLVGGLLVDRYLEGKVANTNRQQTQTSVMQPASSRRSRSSSSSGGSRRPQARGGEERVQVVTTTGRGNLDVTPIDLILILFGGVIKLFGESLKVVRKVTESTDMFVGRYLVLLTTGYVVIKFLHFKLFNDLSVFEALKVFAGLFKGATETPVPGVASEQSKGVMDFLSGMELPSIPSAPTPGKVDVPADMSKALGDVGNVLGQLAQPPPPPEVDVPQAVEAMQQGGGIPASIDEVD